MSRLCHIASDRQDTNSQSTQLTRSLFASLLLSSAQNEIGSLNTPEPRRTLTLSDSATALRVSELLGLMWMDLDFEGLVMYVMRAYVWGRFKQPKSSLEGSGSHAPSFGWFHARIARENAVSKDNDYVFPSVKLGGKKALSASIMVQKYLRPAASWLG
jgi:integrase